MSNSKGFYLIRYSQIASIFGSAISSYALSLWVYDKTQDSMKLFYMTMASFAPQIYMSIFSGLIVDIVKRKNILIFCNILLIVLNSIILCMVANDIFNYDYFLAINFLEGTIISLQSITLLTLISMFFTNKELIKVNSLITVITQFPLLICPVVSVYIYNALGLYWVLFIDLVTFIISMFGVLLVEFPNVNKTDSNSIKNISVFSGLKLILSNPKLKSSLILFMSENAFSGITMGLMLPLLILKSNDNKSLLSYNSLIISSGLLIGGYLIRHFKFYQRKPLLWISIIFILIGLFSRVSIYFVGSIYILSILFCFRNILISFVNACNDVIWQSNVPINEQGKAFGTRRFFAQGTIPLFMLFGSVLISFLFSNSNPLISVYSNLKSLNFELAKLEVIFILSGFLEILSPIIIFIFFKNHILENNTTK